MTNLKNNIIITLTIALTVGFIIVHHQINKQINRLQINAVKTDQLIEKIYSLQELNNALEQQLIVEMGLETELYGLNCND